jgi:hypothetical protein
MALALIAFMEFRMRQSPSIIRADRLDGTSTWCWRISVRARRGARRTSLPTSKLSSATSSPASTVSRCAWWRLVQLKAGRAIPPKRLPRSFRSAERAATRLYDEHLLPVRLTISQYGVLAALYHVPSMLGARQLKKFRASLDGSIESLSSSAETAAGVPSLEREADDLADVGAGPILGTTFHHRA